MSFADKRSKRPWRLTDLSENSLDGRGLGDEGDDTHVRVAVGTDQGQRLRNFSEEDFNADYLGRQTAIVRSLMDHFRRQRLKTIDQSELGADEEDRMMNILHRIIRGAVRVLAVLMAITILWGVVDVGESLYRRLFMPAVQDFGVREIVVTFGAFLAVPIAIEIFMNITLYLRDDVVHVRLVIATALMAIARKVSVFDFEKLQPTSFLATAAVVLALGLVYWLMGRKTVLGARLKRPDNAVSNGSQPQRLAPRHAPIGQQTPT